MKKTLLVCALFASAALLVSAQDTSKHGQTTPQTMPMSLSKWDYEDHALYNWTGSQDAAMKPEVNRAAKHITSAPALLKDADSKGWELVTHVFDRVQEMPERTTAELVR